MEKRCREAVLLLLAISFVFDLILVMGYSKLYEIAQFSQDEYWFLEEIIRLQSLLLDGKLLDIRWFGSPFAYGFPFWFVTALIALPFYGHVALMALFLRFFFMALKYGAFYIVYRQVLKLSHKPLTSALFLALLLIVPAFVFDGKIIGPEYAIMFLVAAGWQNLFAIEYRSQARAAFLFALAASIKINMAPLALVLFPAVYMANTHRDRLRLISYWVIGVVPVLVLFFWPVNPFREILAIGATHNVDYGFQYLYNWYSYNALEFDDMLKGGWGIDFLAWPMILMFAGYAVYRDVHKRKVHPAHWPQRVMTIIVWTFYAALFACFLNSLNSLMHPWFVFAPFLLLVAAACLLISVGREGTVVMLAFLVAYAGWFGPRYIDRWEHRVHKFEYVSATEAANAQVATWIAANCPKARDAVIDYNLLWPGTYNGNLHRMWTLIEVEDMRRNAGGAENLITNIDLLLLKTDRVNALIPPNAAGPITVPGAVLGNFFPYGPPYFTLRQNFPHLSIFAREGVCKKP